MGLFDLFKKKQEEPVAVVAEAAPPVEKIKKPRKPRAKKVAPEPIPEPIPEPTPEPVPTAPEVKVLKLDFDPKNPAIGSMELDWNKEFIESLRTAGYIGNTEEEIVDAWLKDVCRTIANDVPYFDNVRYINRRELGDGKAEFS